MIDHVLARIVADFAIFLEFSDEDTLDPKIAVNLLEDIATSLNDLSEPDRRRFASLIAEIADEAEAEAHADFLRRLPSAAGIT